MATAAPDSRTKLLDAALRVIRTRGYAASSVDDICAAAGLTKGSFFHHFESKEALALAAAQHFADRAEALFAAAPYRALADPLQRVLGYVDFRRALLRGEVPEFTCLLGTMVQEIHATHPAIRDACARHITAHAATLVGDLAEAKRRHAPRARFTPESLALFAQATLQGAFVLAKGSGGPAAADACLAHLRRYLGLLFNPRSEKE